MRSVLRAPLSTIQAHFPLPERVVSPVISPGPCAVGFKWNNRQGSLIGLIPRHYQNCFHNTDQIIAQQGPLTAPYAQADPLGRVCIYLWREETVDVHYHKSAGQVRDAILYKEQIIHQWFHEDWGGGVGGADSESGVLDMKCTVVQ